MAPINRELALSPKKLQIVDKSSIDLGISKNCPLPRFKVIILGDSSVGKTALLSRIILDQFGDYGSTIVGDIYRKTITVEIPDLNILANQSTVDVLLYDTSGNDRYAGLLLPDVMAKASAAIIVYDIADQRSFEDVDKWLERFRKSASNCPLIILVGNKIDLAADPSKGDIVKTVEGEEKASRMNAIFCQVSAKSGQNVQELTCLLGASLMASAVNQRLLITAQPSLESKQNTSSTNTTASATTKANRPMSLESIPDHEHIITVLPGFFKYKIAILGERAVGKTSILTRFLYDSFDPHYQSTIGIDFFSKNVTTDGRTVRLQLWDTAGQERFRSLIPSYIRNSNAAIIVYDVTDRHSFKEVKHWVDEVHCERGGDAVIMLAGNKTDLRASHHQTSVSESPIAVDNAHSMVTTQEGEAKAHELGAFFIEISAKTGYNIQAMFHRMAAALPDSIIANQSGRGGAVNNVVNVEAVEAISTDDNYNGGVTSGTKNNESSCIC